MDRGQHLEQHENDAAERDRAREAVTPLHRADERAHGDGKCRGQHASQHEDNPPDNREGAVGLRQHAEKLPLVTLTQATEQWSPLTGSTWCCRKFTNWSSFLIMAGTAMPRSQRGTGVPPVNARVGCSDAEIVQVPKGKSKKREGASKLEMNA